MTAVRSDDDTTTTATSASPNPRSRLRSVALPSEHGGWGLTAEPILLGLLVAPSWPGALIGLAGMLAFLARTPLKLVLVDASRRRVLDRTVLARRVAAVELLVLVVLVALATWGSSGSFWVPAAVAAPLMGLELWYDMRSKGRRLVPELAGSVGISVLATMIVVAAGGPLPLAVGLWLILAARAITAIPFIRRQVASLHGRAGSAWPLVVSDAAAAVAAVAAVLIEPSLLAGGVAVGAAIVLQRLSVLRPTPRAVVLGIRQTLIGVGVVVVTWLGVLLSGMVVL